MLLGECPSVTGLVLVLCGSSLSLLGIFHPVIRGLVHVGVAAHLGAGDVPIASAAHGSLVDHELNVLALWIKSSVYK